MSNNKDSKIKTADDAMKELEKCQTESGMQIEALREELNEHQDVVASMKEDWDQFIINFNQVFKMINSVAGFFNVLGWIETGVKKLFIVFAFISAISIAVWIFAKTGHWPGIGK